MNKMSYLIPALALLIGLAAGCSRQKAPEVYTIPHEEELTPTQAPGPMASMAGRALPPEALNQSASGPTWDIPEGWDEGTVSSRRRGSFSANGSAGPVDIAVTSFPGDVGGLLANINRWRGQISLSPINEADMESSVARLRIGNKEAIITHMSNGSESTHAAIMEDGGNSWFFKMTGPAETVEEQASAFEAFIQSVRFPEADEAE